MAKGEERTGEVRKDYTKKVESTRDLGERRLKEEAAREEFMVKGTHAKNEHEIAAEKKSFEARKKDLDDAYQNQFKTQVDAHQKNLKHQNETFQSVYSKNNDAQRESLNIQKENYNRELNTLKSGISKKIDHYQQRADDPFYKVEDRGTEVNETSDAYILRTFVPNHEKENVKVKVLNDKAVVAGTRAFKDKVENEDHKISTNSYQTFREEIPFEVPVSTESVVQQREGDFLKVIIPKLGLKHSKA